MVLSLGELTDGPALILLCALEEVVRHGMNLVIDTLVLILAREEFFENTYRGQVLDKALAPKVVLWIFEEFQHDDDETPGVWLHHVHALQDGLDDGLTDFFRVICGEEVQEKIAEEVGVSIRIAELVYQAVDELMQAITQELP
jgi:hypothetical protein